MCCSMILCINIIKLFVPPSSYVLPKNFHEIIYSTGLIIKKFLIKIWKENTINKLLILDDFIASFQSNFIIAGRNTHQLKKCKSTKKCKNNKSLGLKYCRKFIVHQISQSPATKLIYLVSIWFPRQHYSQLTINVDLASYSSL